MNMYTASSETEIMGYPQMERCLYRTTLVLARKYGVQVPLMSRAPLPADDFCSGTAPAVAAPLGAAGSTTTYSYYYTYLYK